MLGRMIGFLFEQIAYGGLGVLAVAAFCLTVY
jgi:hypothetical protein